MSKHKSVRLDDALLTRIQTIADHFGMELSAAMRWAMKKGVAAIEQDVDPPAPAAPRRRIISKGVG